VRLYTPSVVEMLLTWRFAVRSLMNSTSASCVFVSPPASRVEHLLRISRDEQVRAGTLADFRVWRADG
jgi:hypothetical protein